MNRPYLQQIGTLALCLLLVIAGIGAFQKKSTPASARIENKKLPIYCVQKDYKVLSISFDAAWGNEDTQQLIDILDKYGVKATFFVVGGVGG